MIQTRLPAILELFGFSLRYGFYPKIQNGWLNSSDRISNVTDCKNIIHIKNLQAMQRSFLFIEDKYAAIHL